MSALLYKIRKDRTIGDLLDRGIVARIVSLSRQHNTNRKHRMAIYANDIIGVNINQFGFYEREQLEILFDFLAPLKSVFQNGAALDVGANIGNHAVYFSRIFRYVHAFEPNPYTFQLLSFNSQWAPNIVPHNYGFGDKEGLLEMGEDPNNFGASSIKYPGSMDKIEISVRRLDDFDAKSFDVCFMKMDVEGYESNVLEGGLNFIGKYQPLIVLEQHEHEFADNGTRSITLLSSVGYKFCWHQNGSASKNPLVRKLYSIKDLFFGRLHKILSSDFVPVDTYPMLIAVPPRFQDQLGLAPT